MGPIRPLLLTLAAAASAPASAAEWLLCPPLPPAPRVDAAAPGPGETTAVGASAETRGSIAILSGDAGVRRGARTIGADRIRLDRASGEAEATGSVFVMEDSFVVRGRRAEADLDTGAFRIDAATYRERARHVQGRADAITRDDAGVSRLEHATYSTCPDDDQVWHLAADSVELDPNTRQGTARNAAVWFEGVPLFYTPWFRFPIGDERMSGLLVPSFGSSSSSGFTVGVPWYWNAAPNFDATLEPRYLARRGGQLRSEARWLNTWGFWQINNEYLPGDDIYGDDRLLTRIEHDGRIAGWRTRIQAATASDPEYFEDLGTDLSLASQTHLRRRAEARWSGDIGAFRARVQTYQTLDRTLTAGQRPYQQVPQLTFSRQARQGAFETGIDAEYVTFERDDSDTGTRLHLSPALRWNMEAPGWFLRPRIAWDYTAYDLDRATSTGPERPDRSLPLVSLDSGLVFERFSDRWLQTLEPRAFYVYIPAESQDELPIFDTGEYAFSFSQLFRERRFTGPDRLGDANRLTLALTTRVLDREAGREVLRASIGSIQYFDDRTVQLPGRPIERTRRSDLAAQLAIQPTPAWHGSLDLRWDPRADRVREGSLNARFDGGENRVVNAGYRYTRASREAIDLAFAWPLAPQWLAVGGSRYSLFDEGEIEPRNLETFLGVEYDNCCWKLRAIARQYASGRGLSGGTEQDRGIAVELVLKGLGSLGDDAGSMLDRAILGYSQ